MYLFGTTLLVGGIASALLAIASYIRVACGKADVLPYARGGVYGMLAFTVGLWALLVTMFALRRFEFDYVSNYSSSDLSPFFTVAAIWAGQAGSFGIWALWTAIIAALLVGRARHFEPYVLPVISTVLAALLSFMLMINPFVPTIDPASGLVITPPDGNGLNPLLHNFWMIIHPPILFWGFALALVPFAFAVGGLLRRDYDTWVTRALPWTLAAWTLLGLALLLGGYWAYETLGWGGYWGWDPVENSSLVPWLVLTALLHGMLVQRAHGSLRRTNMALALAGFVLVFYSTFLTRSGVLSNFSVHSFVEEGLYGALLGVQLTLLFGSIGLLAWRWRDIPSRELSTRFFSRDTFFALGIITLVALAVLIGVGTSMPVVSALPGVGHLLQDVLGTLFAIDDGSQFGGEPLEDGRFAMAVAFYEVAVPPLGIVAVALLVLGPLLGWRDSHLGKLLHALRIPGAVAVLVTCGALLVGVRDPLPLAYVGLSTFAIGTNLLMIIRTMRGGWLRVGGYLAHLGLSVLLIGVVGSSVYASPDERLSFNQGDTITYNGLDITFNQWEETEDSGGVLNLTVRNGEQSFTAQPELYFDERMGSTIQNPHIQSYIWQDVYFSPAEYVPPLDPSRPVLGVGEGSVIGPYEIAFDGFEIDQESMFAGGVAEVGAKLTVLYEGEIVELIPRVQLHRDEETDEPSFTSLPADLPGGQQIGLLTFHPGQQLVMLEATGEGVENLPIVPGKAVITVSTKPLVILVWVGLIIGILGGAIATVRRYLEGQQRLRGQAVQLPKGLPKGLASLPGKLRWRGSSAAR